MQIQINPATINAFDRLTHYGDGCFTTAAFSQGYVEYLDAHLKRLEVEAAALRLGITATELDSIKEVLQTLATESQNGVLKVMLSSGLSERGYQRSESAELQVYVFVLPQVKHYLDWRADGITLGVASYRLGSSKSLAQLKHVNRLEQVLAKDGIKNDVDDLLVCNEPGHVIESTSANVFFKIGTCWFTPEIINSGIEGVMRNRVMQLLKDNGQHVQEITTTLTLVQQATDMFICNSLMHVVPVNQVRLPGETVLNLGNNDVATVQALVEQDLLANVT